MDLVSCLDESSLCDGYMLILGIFDRTNVSFLIQGMVLSYLS